MRKNVWKTWKKAVLSLAVMMLVTAGLAVTAKAGGASFEEAQPITVGQRQQLSFETSGEAQYYCFTTDSVAGWYSINFGKSGGERKYLDVYATPDMSSPVLRDWSLYNDGNASTLLTLSPNKKYYIMVVPYNNHVGGTVNFTITKINDDYGNDLATGRVIPLGTTITGNIEVADKGEVDAFRFTTTGNNSYYGMTISCTGGVDTCARIYEGPDTSYNFFEVSAGPSNTKSVAKKLEKNKTYYVVLDGNYWDDPTSYKFSVKEIRDDYGNDLATGKMLSLGSLVSGNIEVDDNGEVDAFRFTTTGNNSYYEMALSCTGSSYACAKIYKGPDTSYDCFELSADPSETKSIVERLEKNKTYYVIVGRNYWDDSTSYKFVVKEVKDDAGNDFADATKLSNGKTASKTIQVENDTDFFKFKTKKKEAYYLLTFKNKSKNGMRVTVYNNNDIASAINEVNNMYVDGASTKTMWIKLKKNKYNYIKVTGGGNCSYSIQLKDVKSVVKKTAPSSFKAKGYSGYWSRYTTLTWKHKYENAKYEIYRSTSSKSGFKKIKTLTNAASYTDNTVKKGTTYYYKIRYCVKENGKVCKAKWSKVKKVKIN